MQVSGQGTDPSAPTCSSIAQNRPFLEKGRSLVGKERPGLHLPPRRWDPGTSIKDLAIGPLGYLTSQVSPLHNQQEDKENPTSTQQQRKRARVAWLCAIMQIYILSVLCLGKACVAGIFAKANLIQSLGLTYTVYTGGWKRSYFTKVARL